MMLLPTSVYDYVLSSTNQIGAQFIELKNVFIWKFTDEYYY